MNTLTIYSSAPSSTRLAVAFQGLLKLGVPVQLRPLSDYPAPPAPRKRLSSLRVESAAIGRELRAIDERLDDHTSGARRLGPGERQELIATRDALAARRRQIEVQLQEGGQDRG